MEQLFQKILVEVTNKPSPKENQKLLLHAKRKPKFDENRASVTGNTE